MLICISFVLNFNTAMKVSYLTHAFSYYAVTFKLVTVLYHFLIHRMCTDTKFHSRSLLADLWQISI